ncbi:MAG: tRNA (adenosine(37)-N6)-threonylcarbamoyltransferase complex ATPase subunit type 1 TsaE [Hasllibacter sp.]
MPLADIHLDDPQRTDRVGAAIASHLRPGDTVLLEGPLGSGKTHLARAIVRAVVGADIEVTSPTFTIVQTYAAPAAEIWHADLYRLRDPSELDEIGLRDAVGDVISLIEWPDRLGWTPEGALTATLSDRGTSARGLVLSGDEGRWAAAADAARIAVDAARIAGADG